MYDETIYRFMSADTIPVVCPVCSDVKNTAGSGKWHSADGAVCYTPSPVCARSKTTCLLCGGEGMVFVPMNGPT
jgi:hypothetical protein